ncbi:MAG TPA: TIGR01777 family oxidoreductase, partial [Tessaracoccus flavescens]|nr:TIGR01777 family oxidoreductase [Tessaracoccus flavescens]
IPLPRERVFAWYQRPGALARMSPPGWGDIPRGVRELTDVGDEMTLKGSHPLLAVTPGGSKLPMEPGLATLTELVPGSSHTVTVRQGKFEFAQHSTFEDSPGGTRVTSRVVGKLPPGAESPMRNQFRFLHQQAAADLAFLERLGWPEARTIAVAGSSGLVGTQLVGLLRMAGHRVIQLVRDGAIHDDEVVWDPTRHHLPGSVVEEADVIVNLAGHTIGGRFSEENKRLIQQSRVHATTTLARALAVAPEGKTLIQASAVGIYGARRPGELLTEESPRGDGFLADVVAAWEYAAEPAREAGVRTAFVRTGIALSYGGGALQRQIPLYLVGAGGRLGPAHHMLPWIDLDDLVRAYVHAIFTPSLTGPVNAVAPEPVTNAEFASTLGAVLKRPAALPTPAFGPKLLLGSEGYDQLINTDQRVSAQKLLDSGFEFAYPTLEPALRHELLR